MLKDVFTTEIREAKTLRHKKVFNLNSFLSFLAVSMVKDDISPSSRSTRACSR